MLSLLLKVKLNEFIWIFTGAHRTRKAQAKGKLIAFSALMLFAMGALGSMFWHIFDMVAAPFTMFGLGWLYYALAALMAFAVMFVGSVFAAKSMLYEARDNDLLLSMPIKPGYILLSRMSVLYLLNFGLELIVAVPAVMASEGLSGAGLVCFVLLFALLPFFTLAVSALFGWLLSEVTNRLGRSSAVTVLLSVAFLGLYFVFVSQINVWLERLAENPEGTAKALGAVAPLYWLGKAVSEGSWGFFARAAALFAGSFVLACVILSKTFIRVVTDRRSLKKKRYVAHEAKAASPKRALFRRELQRLLSSPAYMLNGALGSVFCLVGAAAVFIKGGELTAIPDFDLAAQILSPLGIAAVCFCAGTTLITAPSVSLEGRSLWIVRSAPVETRDVLRAKLLLHLTVGLPPVLFLSAALAWLFRADGLMLALQLAVPALFCLFSGLLGLMESLRHPNFDWVNETQAVKSGLGVMFTMFICWGVLAIPVLAYVFWGEFISVEALCLVSTAVLAVLCLLLWRWLRTKGERIFDAL